MISKKALNLAALIGLCIAASPMGRAQPQATPPPAPKANPPATPKSPPAAATSSASMTTEAAIKTVLERQAFDWNRGDTDGFLVGYAPDAIFVSDTVTRGLEQLRVRYQSHYPTRASMGKLTFSDIEVHTIDANNALVIGRFHLERDTVGGGNTQGVYTLLFKRGPKGWKIAVDHTS
jgi:uncharacterized protein (TIGR02246 family)